MTQLPLPVDRDFIIRPPSHCSETTSILTIAGYTFLTAFDREIGEALSGFAHKVVWEKKNKKRLNMESFFIINLLELIKIDYIG